MKSLFTIEEVNEISLNLLLLVLMLEESLLDPMSRGQLENTKVQLLFAKKARDTFFNKGHSIVCVT